MFPFLLVFIFSDEKLAFIIVFIALSMCAFSLVILKIFVNIAFKHFDDDIC